MPGEAEKQREELLNHMHRHMYAHIHSHTHIYTHIHTHMYTYTHNHTHTHSSYMTLIGVHEMHGRVGSHHWPILYDNLLLPVAGKLPIKT